MISNPCSFYISGNETKNFTHEGGNKLYHFSPNDNNISDSMECNVIFLANNEEHALDILKRMIEFYKNCSEEYIRNSKDNYYMSTAEKNISMCNQYIELLNNNKLKVSEAPINQFFQIGWAYNDTINLYKIE